MPITEAQRKRRARCLGSSDMAAVLGFSAFGNAYDVWLEKTGRLTKENESDVMQRGNYMEDAILRYAEDQLGPLKRNQYRSVRKQGIPMGANVDAIVNSTGYPVEAKSKGFFAAESWGDPGTDAVPYRVIIQAHVHMICTGTDYCHIPVYLPIREFQMYGVSLDAEIASAIKEAATTFWNDCVLADVPPDDVQPRLKAARRMIRTPDKTVELTDDLVNRWLDAKAEVSMAKEAKEMAEAEMLAVMNDAEAGECSMGMVTYFPSTSKRLDTKRIKAERPDIANAFTKVTESRTLRFKQSKKKAS